MRCQVGSAIRIRTAGKIAPAIRAFANWSIQTIVSRIVGVLIKAAGRNKSEEHFVSENEESSEEL
jgi:hypothetical protein